MNVHELSRCWNSCHCFPRDATKQSPWRYQEDWLLKSSFYKCFVVYEFVSSVVQLGSSESPRFHWMYFLGTSDSMSLNCYNCSHGDPGVGSIEIYHKSSIKLERTFWGLFAVGYDGCRGMLMKYFSKVFISPLQNGFTYHCHVNNVFNYSRIPYYTFIYSSSLEVSKNKIWNNLPVFCSALGTRNWFGASI